MFHYEIFICDRNVLWSYLPSNYPLHVLLTPTDLLLSSQSVPFLPYAPPFLVTQCVYMGLLSQDHGWGVVYGRQPAGSYTIEENVSSTSGHLTSCSAVSKVYWGQEGAPGAFILWNRVFFSHETTHLLRWPLYAGVWAWPHKLGEAGSLTSRNMHKRRHLKLWVTQLSSTEKLCSAGYSDVGISTVSREGHWGWLFICNTKLCSEVSEQWSLSSVALEPGSEGHLGVYEGKDGPRKRSKKEINCRPLLLGIDSPCWRAGRADPELADYSGLKRKRAALALC